MKKLKLITISSIALLALTPTFADDFGFTSFGDDTVSTGDSFSSDDSSFGSFDSSIFGGDVSSDDGSSLQFTGTAGLTTRAYLRDKDNVISGEDDFESGETYTNPSLKLDLSYSDTNSDLTGSILLNNDSINNYQEDIINELTYRAYVDNFVLEAGKTKIVWGRGDKIHVLDLLNANDLTSFIIPDYIDRRIAEPEVDVTWNIPSEKNLSLQLVFTPGMSVDRLDTSGRWTPDAVASIKSLITTYATTKITAAETAGGTIGALLAAEKYTDEDYYYADTNNLEYAQYGARLTGTQGEIDWGAQYYFGHYKTPSIKDVTTDINLDYDQLQVFGVDAETVKGAYTMRGELAYYLTEDIDGDDYSTHNNSIKWVAGFDRSLPWGNLSLNVQELGSYTLNYDKVQDNVSTYNFDMDENNADCASNNKIIAKLSDTMWHENLKPAISVLYGIEGVDLVLMPEISYIVKDGFEVTTSANLVFSDENTGEYSAYNNNAEIQLNVEYNF
jgi:hypothetical protein